MNDTAETDLTRFLRDRGSHCLIIARHGETEWNAEGRLQGRHDTSLNARGRDQAFGAGRFLQNVLIDEIHSSTLVRCRKTSITIAEVNIGLPQVVYSEFLEETALGVLEGELKDRQSSIELTEHYRNFSRDEIRYRIPGGENLHDVFARVERFFGDERLLLRTEGIHLIVGHRNVNKMIIKFLLGLTFEEGFQVEHEHERLYFYFGGEKELWSCPVGDACACFTQGYATVDGGGSYA